MQAFVDLPKDARLLKFENQLANSSGLDTIFDHDSQMRMVIKHMTAVVLLDFF